MSECTNEIVTYEPTVFDIEVGMDPLDIEFSGGFSLEPIDVEFPISEIVLVDGAIVAEEDDVYVEVETMTNMYGSRSTFVYVGPSLPEIDVTWSTDAWFRSDGWFRSEGW